jgi:leader peptidase (prepilin peptidase) / N-methyltransferase
MAAFRPGAATMEARAGNTVDGSTSAAVLAHPGPVLVIGSALAALAFVTGPSAAQGLLGGFVAAVLVVLAATDLEHRIIPNRIVLPAAAIALAANIALSPGRSPEFLLAALGLGIAFFLPNLINASLMGMGDVKLIMLLGAGLGWAAVGAVLIGFLSIFPVAVMALIRGGTAARKTTLPFGPFLALGGLVILIAPHLIG